MRRFTLDKPRTTFQVRGGKLKFIAAMMKVSIVLLSIKLDKQKRASVPLVGGPAQYSFLQSLLLYLVDISVLVIETRQMNFVKSGMIAIQKNNPILRDNLSWRFQDFCGLILSLDTLEAKAYIEG